MGLSGFLPLPSKRGQQSLVWSLCITPAKHFQKAGCWGKKAKACLPFCRPQGKGIEMGLLGCDLAMSHPFKVSRSCQSLWSLKDSATYRPTCILCYEQQNMKDLLDSGFHEAKKQGIITSVEKPGRRRFQKIQKGHS